MKTVKVSNDKVFYHLAPDKRLVGLPYAVPLVIGQPDTWYIPLGTSVEHFTDPDYPEPDFDNNPAQLDSEPHMPPPVPYLTYPEQRQDCRWQPDYEPRYLLEAGPSSACLNNSPDPSDGDFGYISDNQGQSTESSNRSQRRDSQQQSHNSSHRHVASARFRHVPTESPQFVPHRASTYHASREYSHGYSPDLIPARQSYHQP